MIFVCLGTKRFPFNRLLKQIDVLVEQELITDEVFAQIGHSTYIPKYYEYVDFLTPKEYKEKINEANIVITHGGVGSIISALKARKQVIGVPRKYELGEHADNHQFQIVELFYEQGYIKKVIEMEELERAINDCKVKPINKSFHSDGKIVDIIENFIENS